MVSRTLLETDQFLILAYDAFHIPRYDEYPHGNLSRKRKRGADDDKQSEHFIPTVPTSKIFYAA
jgi:hypothetical protein